MGIFWDTSATLTLNAANDIVIQSGVTITGTPAGSLFLNAGQATATGGVTIGSSNISVNTFSAQAGTSGKITLNSFVQTSGGGQTYSSPVTIAADSGVDDSGSGAIHFASTVDAASAGGESLTINGFHGGTGPVTFGGRSAAILRCHSSMSAVRGRSR